jgi:quinohemoprotein ethanol dehydrogenase
VGLFDGHVIALKEKTGELSWARKIGPQDSDEQRVGGAPTYKDGQVFVGLSNSDAFMRGALVSLDATTGNERWQTFAIPAPGEPGHETWIADNDVWKSGGGAVWTTPAVDSELGLVYFATGNPAPAFGGELRPGDNLYTCSVIAVEEKTGKIRWYYQLVHHDVFEGDLGTPVVLFDARVNGRLRKGLAVLRADGYLFQLDRISGKPLQPVEERPVPQLAAQRTAPTQPFPVGGDSVLTSCEEWSRSGIPAGFVLGCMWSPPVFPPPSGDPQNVLAPFPNARTKPIAYSPQTGYFYTQSVSILGWPRRSTDPYFVNYTSSVPGLKVFGQLTAIDRKTGKIAWQERLPPEAVSGGVLVTAGGSVFRSSGDGNVEAYDAKLGKVVWRFQTGMPGSQGSPASYVLNGEQYVAVSMGSSVWAFRLGGAASNAAPPSFPSIQNELTPPPVDAEQVETTSLRSSFLPGPHYFVDEYTFNPYQARVTAGTKLRFRNNGSTRHEIVALDGSWGTGPLNPAEEAWVTFETPGQYTYVCKDHPWSYGRVIVVPKAAAEARGGGSTAEGSDDWRERARRGMQLFRTKCALCHGDDLRGRTSAPALSGHVFAEHWGTGTVGDLFDKIQTTMPPTSPGALDAQTTFSIAAYLLQANDIDVGNGATESVPAALHDIKVRKSP